jgi:hypothetical protein
LTDIKRLSRIVADIVPCPFTIRLDEQVQNRLVSP